MQDTADKVYQVTTYDDTIHDTALTASKPVYLGGM